MIVTLFIKWKVKPVGNIRNINVIESYFVSVICSRPYLKKKYLVFLSHGSAFMY